MKSDSERVLFACDLAGTFVFALEGARAAADAGLDYLGVLVLAFATALAGGIVRDLLIGAVPPQAIRDVRYPLTAFTGGVVVIFLHGFTRPSNDALMALDAAGLSLFAVAGTKKALGYGIHPLMAILLGAVTGAGGGTVRDLMLSLIPAVLRVEIYAVAALSAGTVMVIAGRLGCPPLLGAVLGGVVCFVLRVTGFKLGWSLPHL